MALTQKQENFCLAYIKCGNATQAYKDSYTTTKSKPETINENASRTLADSKIIARLDELRAKAVNKAIMSVEQRKELLTKIAQNVTFDKDGNAGFTDATKAIDLLNKMEALYVQKNQTELSGEVGVTFHIDLGDESN